MFCVFIILGDDDDDGDVIISIVPLFSNDSRDPCSKLSLKNDRRLSLSC